MKSKNNKSQKNIAIICLDMICAIIATVIALVIPYNNSLTSEMAGWWILINIVLVITINGLCKLYSFIFESVGLYELMKLGICNIIIIAVELLIQLIGFDIAFTEILVFSLIEMYLSVVVRFSIRIVKYLKKKFFKHKCDKKRVLIIGAGSAGTTIVREMQTSNKINEIPVCMLDDDPMKLGNSISGVPILAKTGDVKRICLQKNIDKIIIAMPSADKQCIKRIVNLCHDLKIKVQTVPGIYQIVSGQILFSSIRDVEISDLLGRDSINVNLDEIMGYIEGKTVLVTGGGGSIGSELCRQIALHKPKKLIIFDIYENSLYDIELELKHKFPSLDILALVGSIRGSKKVEDLFKTYHPQIVFNAAAHKHVPLMESSPNEAIKNNVFGTLHMARMADKYKADRFVQISTDKAVNPTNIMGASKRICEMIIQSIGKTSKHCEFVAVRFGNVLGSNGSVIPIFKKQISEGGPVTITDKRIIRYFMTIPEAVSLVLQAGAYAKGGEIYVLDMGEPVKIYDLACNLIKLSGLIPNKDIMIEEIGLRPGEKLYEERLMKEEGLQKTANGLISIAKPIEFDDSKFFETLNLLYKEAYSETDRMKEYVKELVPTYSIDKRERK